MYSKYLQIFISYNALYKILKGCFYAIKSNCCQTYSYALCGTINKPIWIILKERRSYDNNKFSSALCTSCLLYTSLKAKKVTAVEIDKALIPILNDVMSDFDNFNLINSDILELNINELIKNEFDNESFTVVANLPYYITTPIIMNFLESELPVNSMTLMIQKEVAARILAEPGTKDYGALSVAVQFLSLIHI